LHLAASTAHRLDAVTATANSFRDTINTSLQDVKIIMGGTGPLFTEVSESMLYHFKAINTLLTAQPRLFQSPLKLDIQKATSICCIDQSAESLELLACFSFARRMMQKAPEISVHL
jgi:hypothetical protein